MPFWWLACAKIRVRSYFHARSAYLQYKKNSFIEQDDDFKLCNESSMDNYLSESECYRNRVMVVIDSSPEAEGAVEWVLSHIVQSQDVIILLHVKQDAKIHGKTARMAYDLLCSFKKKCQKRRPEVRVEMAFQHGKEKAAIIVEEANRLRASLLVLGKKRQSLLLRLRMVWTRKRTRSQVVDYCIQHANCMTIAVRRKHRNHGGYLITTKLHKNFWLLA